MIDFFNFVVGVLCAFILGLATHSIYLHEKHRRGWRFPWDHNEEKNEKMVKKEGKIVIKDGVLRWTERDWRGVIAIIITSGLLVSIVLGRVDGIGTFGSLAAMVCRDYFASKQEKRKGK